MTEKEYKLRYLPLFYQDLEQKVTYIAVVRGISLCKMCKGGSGSVCSLFSVRGHSSGIFQY